MAIHPKQFGKEKLSKEELSKDRKTIRKFGPCGVGEKALYLNSFYIDRRYYLPVSSIERVYKRIAMSRGGFTGKGIFASIPYLVVEYDGGKSRQFNFKQEEQVDDMLDYIGKCFPAIPRLSSKGEEMILEKEREKQAFKYPDITEEAQELVSYLENVQEYLNKRPELFDELAAASKKKRTFERTKPAYKWAAAAFLLLGAVMVLGGIFAVIIHESFAIYFVLIGFAILLLFSGSNVLPTLKDNRKSIEERLGRAVDEVDNYLKDYPDFTFPARYAHPVTIKWMREVALLGKAQTMEEAYEYVKDELKKLNADVEVERDVYNDVMAIKPMFLVWNYQ